MSETWLVVVDPQRIFADPASEWGSPMFADIVEPVRELAARFGPERTLVTRWLPDGPREGSWVDYFARWPFADRPADDPAFAVVEALSGLSAHPSLDRPTFGKWGPQMAAVVGPTPTLVLTGVSTDCCVISTALAAADAGARVLVAADACAGSTETDHAAALQVMGLYDPQICLATSPTQSPTP